MSEHKRVAIIGGGLGGIGAAIKLKESGRDDFVILEKNPKVGGVWHENNYPGCACDVPIALYQYSFARSANWSHLFPRAHQVQAYAEELIERYDLRSHLRTGEGVKSARWLKDQSRWRIETEKERSLEADVIIPALGQLNRPALPSIAGLEAFQGPKIHSARWDSAISLKGKRVGIIGTAASAVQIIPEIAADVAHLSIFQRSPNWVIPRNDRAISDEEKALMATRPEAAMRINENNREMIYENAESFLWQTFSWTPEGRTAYERVALNHMHEQISDPALRKKLTPDYPIGCKRILFSDDFYPTLLRNNVSLITDPIRNIDAAGVCLAKGAHKELDVLVLATGFETTQWKWSMEVSGLSGKTLHQHWADAPQAYLGITVHDFPNMFVLYGPNTNLGHNSILIMLEDQINYAIRSLDALEKSNAPALMPRKEAQDKFNKQIQADLKKRVWSDPHCVSWYKNADGLVTQNWSSNTRDYDKATARFEPKDYAFIGGDAS